MKTFVSITLFILITLTQFGCVNIFQYSDLRPIEYIYPNDVNKAKLLLQEMGIAHRNHLWDSIETYNVDFGEESFGFLGKKSSPFKELNMQFSLSYVPKTEIGLVRILSGKEQGKVWGVQNSDTYQVIDGQIVPTINNEYRFSINAFQYFIELPNRITEATVLDYLGTQIIDGIMTEGIILSWNTLDTQKGIDQYAIWLDSNTKQIVKVDYTIREKFKFVKGEAYYKDYKEFYGFLLPTVIESKSNIKKNGYLHIKKIYGFTPNVLTIDYLQPLTP